MWRSTRRRGHSTPTRDAPFRPAGDVPAASKLFSVSYGGQLHRRTLANSVSSLSGRPNRIDRGQCGPLNSLRLRPPTVLPSHEIQTARALRLKCCSAINPTTLFTDSELTELRSVDATVFSWPFAELSEVCHTSRIWRIAVSCFGVSLRRNLATCRSYIRWGRPTRVADVP
jgi:hypothetical protein